MLSQPSDGDSSDQGRKGVKRKMPTLVDEFELAPKRRSTRVESLSCAVFETPLDKQAISLQVKPNMRKKEEETVNYSERLQRFVPPKLKYGSVV